RSSVRARARGRDRPSGVQRRALRPLRRAVHESSREPLPLAVDARLIRARPRIGVAAIAVLAAVVVPRASGEGAGALQLRAEFSWAFSVQRDDTTCPAGTPALAICQPHASSGLVPGLGGVSMSYVYTVLASSSCPGSSAQVLGYTARFTVVGKVRSTLPWAASPIASRLPARRSSRRPSRSRSPAARARMPVRAVPER